MKKTRGAYLLLTAWILVLGMLGYFVQRNLTISADLRFFLPEPKSAQQKLLLNEIGEGPASRLLVVALSHAEQKDLATTSRALAASLSQRREFHLVANGEVEEEAIPEELWAYRYLVSPTFNARVLSADNLHTELAARMRDLSSPAGAFLESIVQRDPTLEILKLVEAWQPSQQPRREYDVWFDRAGKSALLLVAANAPAFDPDGQAVALNVLRAEFETARGNTGAQMEISGVGVFSALMKDRTQTEVQWIGSAETLAMIALLWFAYRRVSIVILNALPLMSAGIVGLLAVSVLFDAIHGITLAFGFTLIGVAQDYPIHLLSHRTGEVPVQETARRLWPTLATGVASTCIAYLTFYFSGVVGLAQLATFTIAGLICAAACTRFILPHLIEAHGIDYGNGDFLARINDRFMALPHFYKSLAALVVVSIAVLLWSPTPFWQNDLSRLTPVPTHLLERDQALRNELGTADVRYLFAVTARDEAAARVRLEALDDDLRSLTARGAIKSFDHIARYVPSAALQKQRQELLPNKAELRGTLDRALVGLDFRSDAFDPFLADIERAKTIEPLTLADLKGTPLEARADMLVAKSAEGVTALITLSGVGGATDIQALKEFSARAGSDVLFLDLKGASESLVAEQRTWILKCLGLACVLLIAVVFVALRDIRRVLRVLAPMALTTLLILAILRGAGVSLSLFHLISLILAAGLGLDYALFFEHSAHDPSEQRRTLHAVLVCSAATLLVFGLLGLSTLPVLQAIGVTAALGVVGNFVLALVITRDTSKHR